MVEVTIIIPVYNAEKYLKRCLDSVLNQTLKEIEVICINDNSTDRTVELLESIKKNESRLKLINCDTNYGASIARNKGISAAKGKYLGFVDSDDFVDLDYFEKLVNKANLTDADVVKGSIKELDSECNLISDSIYNINSKVKANKAYFYHSFTSAIYKRSFIIDNSIEFPSNISHFEDPYFSIKASIYCNKIEIEDDANYYYVRNNESETKKQFSFKTFVDVRDSLLLMTNLINSASINKQHYIIVYDFLFKNALNYSMMCSSTKEAHDKFIQLIVFMKKNRKYEIKRIRNVNPSDLLNKYISYDYLNVDESTIKILVSYIKPSFLFSSKVLTPIHLGRSVEVDFSKDGYATKEALNWLHNNCIGDDDFVSNISRLNRRVGFLTGTYWAWKNYEKLGNPKYFGSFGYRKLFDPSFLKDLSNYDLILPLKETFTKSIKDQFIDAHGKDFFEVTLSSIKAVHPDDLDLFNEYFEQHSGYFFEIYVMKKELFFEFCTWIFPILGFLTSQYTSHIEMKPNFNFDKTKFDLLLRSYIPLQENLLGKNEIRDFAFMLERLTGLYLYKLTKDKNCKYCEVEVLSPEKNINETQKINFLAKLRKNISK